MINKKGFIQDPKTLEEAAHNAKFQCDNVDGWLYAKDYECAMIKAKCLIKALEVVLRIEGEKVKE